ncbi:Bicoid-interacting protein 3-domain-containing protein [Dissophora ornata]|nr:Bicoid-interacting protein 3-domain-containing protein [Dissophora ornata]
MPLQELAKKVDLRLEFLDPSWFRGKRVVDIGCNAALLTVFIAMHYKPRKIQGVDIDPSLIGKAQNFILKTFSQISPQAYTQTRGGSGNNESSTVEEEEEEEEEEDVPYEEYFPKSMHRIHGFLPVPKRTLRTEVLFPHNIELRVTDWVTETEDQQDTGAEQWDVILGFSLAKWVHLHHGDTGMKRFFQKVYRSLAPGGIFLLEPQAFETYNRRSKLTPVMQENYKAMTFKPQNFQEYLLSDKVGFREAMHLGHSEGGAKNFNRDIFLYRK